MTQQLTSSPRRKLLDEGAFQELLSAAFTLQQHNQLANNPSTSPTEVLTEIVRIQRFIREGKADLADTAKLISRQAQTFANADGVAIGILAGEELVYLAAVGTASRDLGRRVRRDSCLSENCLRTGLTFSTSDTLDDRRLASSSDYADVRSFIAVPVGYDRNIVGVLEARFKAPNAFTEGDVHNCELIAALVKELIARAGKARADKKAPSEKEDAAALDERGNTAEASKLMDLPNSAPRTLLEAGPSEPKPASPLTVTLPSVTAPAVAPPKELPIEALTQNPEPPVNLIPETKSKRSTAESGNKIVASKAAGTASTEAAVCRGCGQRLSEEEVFCGNCGMKRAIKPGGPLQSKWASLWYMKQAYPQKAKDKVSAKSEAMVAPLVQQLPMAKSQELEEDGAFEIEAEKGDSAVRSAGSTAIVGQSFSLAEADSETPSLHVEWLPDAGASASKNWLVHQWKVNRANFYLAGAVMLLVLVLFGVGTAPETRPANATGPQLTLMEKMLVGMGIAEAPQSAENRGNPDTPVWVDLHTALYYCPGSDQYGRTEGGKIATQRSAQLDQFEPAHRKACN